MRFFFKDTATVERLTQSGDKSSYASQGTVNGYLEPLDTDMGAIGDVMVGQGYRFVCDGDEDINTSDKITIDSVDYVARGTRVFEAGGLFLLEVQLEKSVKH